MDSAVTTRETLLVIHRCLERLDFTTAASVLQSSLKQEVSNSLSFLVVPYLLLIVSESTFYTMNFPDGTSDLERLYESYGLVLADVNDVTAVMDTVAGYNSNTDEVFQAKFISTLLKQVQILLVCRRQIITVFLSLYNEQIIPNFKKLSISLGPFQKKLEERISSPLLTQQQENLISEIEAISNLLMTQHCISKLQLPDSLCYLYKCKSEIDSWKYRYVQHEDPTLPINTGFFSWTRKFLASLAAKLCFYFPESFLNQKNATTLDNADHDHRYGQMLREFADESKCAHFRLFRLASDRTDSQRKYKILLSYPQTTVYDASITSFLKSSREFLNNFENRELYFWDEKKTLFLWKSDHHLVIALVFEGKREVNDPIIAPFCAKLKASMRFWDLIEDPNPKPNPS